MEPSGLEPLTACMPCSCSIKLYKGFADVFCALVGGLTAQPMMKTLQK